jgi:hypothetical protein
LQKVILILLLGVLQHSDSSGNIFLTATQELFFLDILLGEASTALLASRLAIQASFDKLYLKKDSLLMILVVKSPYLNFLLLEFF